MLEVTGRQPPDPAHDIAHLRRVVGCAMRLARTEGARLEVVLPAAWLHDLVWVAKNDPRRSEASILSALAAVELLKEWGYPAELLPEVGHAIEAHSYSAGVEPRTLEAEIVQDADRLDALGAVGVARCFATAGSMGSSLENAVQHFHDKLFKIVETLRTEAARTEGRERAGWMRDFLARLACEMHSQ